MIERYWEPPVAGVDGVSRPRPLARRGGRRGPLAPRGAVERRLVSDVPLGRVPQRRHRLERVVGIMAVAARPARSQTFTIGFDDREGFDERPYARLVAERHRHRPPRVRRPAGCGRPGRAARLAPRPAVRRLERGADLPAQRGHPRARDGRPLRATAATRLFAGYERFAAGLAARRYAALPGAAARGGARRRRAAPAGGAPRTGRQRCSASPAWPSWGCPTRTARGSATSRSPSATRCSTAARDDWALEDYRRVWAASAGAHPLDRLLDLNLRTYLLDDLLVKTDRMSMAHGLEVRSPVPRHRAARARGPAAAARSRPAA